MNIKNCKIINGIKQLWYLGWWFVGARFFGKKKPLQTVIFITDKCNLRCKHCSVYDVVGGKHRPFADIVSDLQWAYDQGSRFLDIEGGETTLYKWPKNDTEFYNLNDVIEAARNIGFFSITITTNAQQDFSWVKIDSLWVSMDGVGKYHEAIRGDGTFARLEKNIANSGQKRLTVNMVINQINYEGLEEALEYVKNSRYIKMISLNFHTPFPGTEDLMLSNEQKIKALDTIIAYKRKHYPIMNSVSGLKKMYPEYMNTHQVGKLCWITSFIYPNGDRGNCVGIQSEILEGHVKYMPTDICKRCGFCMSGEMTSVFNFCPDTLLAGLNLRM